MCCLVGRGSGMVLGSATFCAHLFGARHARHVICNLIDTPARNDIRYAGAIALLVSSFIFLFSNPCLASSIVPDSLTIATIEITGNKTTRREVVLREILVEEGQRIAAKDLKALVAESHRLLQNTTLFLSSVVEPCYASADSVSICVRVREAWYIYPVVIFELADRNFKIWWKDQNASLERVNYGIYVNHFNLTGRRDLLKLKFQHGYSQKYDLSYDLQQLPGQPNWGAGFSVSYQRNHEVQYNTIADKQLFYKDDSEWIGKKLTSSLFVSYRPGVIWRHRLAAHFRSIQVDSLIVHVLNPNYFAQPTKSIRFLSLHWQSRMDRLIDRPYPFRGYALQWEMVKEGFGAWTNRDRWWASIGGQFYWPTGRQQGFEWIGRIRGHLQRQNMGFFEYNALGYGNDVLRGYEKYTLDGLDFAYVKMGWRTSLFSYEVPMPMPNWPVLNNVRCMPFQIYGSVYSDHGFVNDPFNAGGNRLRNRLLSSVGVGLDFRFYFDKILYVMWSFNQLGENGLFLQTKISFR